MWLLGRQRCMEGTVIGEVPELRVLQRSVTVQGGPHKAIVGAPKLSDGPIFNVVSV